MGWCGVGMCAGVRDVVCARRVGCRVKRMCAVTTTEHVEVKTPFTHTHSHTIHTTHTHTTHRSYIHTHIPHTDHTHTHTHTHHTHITHTHHTQTRTLHTHITHTLSSAFNSGVSVVCICWNLLLSSSWYSSWSVEISRPFRSRASWHTCMNDL